MDSSLVKADRLCPVYEKGVLEFLEHAKKYLHGNNEIFYCSCVTCWNINKTKIQRKKYSTNLCYDGIYQNCTIWTWHGEIDKKKTNYDVTKTWS